MSAPALELIGIRKDFGRTQIIRGVDLAVPRGERHAIIGPNGAGKSTLFNLISGRLRPSAGAIRLNGADVTGARPQEINRRGLARSFQITNIFPRLSVWENVRLGAYTVGDRRLVERRLAEVCETFPLVNERRHEPAASLSGGQQKIVEFARAMMLDPALLILDEPSMGLDPKTRSLVFTTVKEMNRAGRTLLLVEQNARSGLGIATHGVVMETGRVRLEGPGLDVLNNPEIGRLYLGATA